MLSGPEHNTQQSEAFKVVTVDDETVSASIDQFERVVEGQPSQKLGKTLHYLPEQLSIYNRPADCTSLDM